MVKVFDVSPSTPQPRSIVKRFALGGVALAATALATLGLYGHTDTFHHDSTRLLSEVVSARGIQVTLRDATGLQVHGMLLPRASATPEALAFDGRLSYELGGSQYNFTLVDDRAYVTVEDLKTGKLTRNACIRPENVPPVATLTDALRHARVIDAVTKSDVTCASGKMIEFAFAGEPYAMCAGVKDGSVAVHGDDLQASLTLLRDNSEGIPSVASLAPTTGLNLETCAHITPTTGDANLVKYNIPRMTTRALQRTKDALTVATGGRRLGKMASSECSCSNGLKKCLFVHGLGYSAGNPTDSFQEYFGTIQEQAKCCSETKFLHIDTLNSPWYADASTDAVCNQAARMTRSTNKMAIEDVVIVAHSMGNLVVNAAFMNKKCGLAKSSKYIALNGPMYGSMSATSGLSILKSLPKSVVDLLCSNSPLGIIDNPILKALTFFGLCPTRISLSSITFKGSKESTPELDKMLQAVGEQFGKSVSSSLCGVSYQGLATSDAIQLSVLGQLSGHASAENDGQVHIDSCRATIPISKYSTSWDGGNFYKASINHLDGTFRNGDGWWGDDRKPIKWFNCQF